MMKSSFVADTFTLVGGNVIAECIVIALTPIITRLYPPQSYGIFSIFLSIALPFTFISSQTIKEPGDMVIELFIDLFDREGILNSFQT